MVTVGVNDSDIITIAGKSATQKKSEPGKIEIEEVVAIKIRGVEEAVDLVQQLLYAIRKESYDRGLKDAYMNM